MNRYFAVEAKCGHVGKGKCIFIWFAVKAEDAKEAAKKARTLKRVKHHHKNAIRRVQEISFGDYAQLLFFNGNDEYLQCKNIQQQRMLDDLEERIETDEYALSLRERKSPNRDTAYLLKKFKIQTMDALHRIREVYYLEDIAV